MKKISFTSCLALALNLLGGNAQCQSLAAQVDVSQVGKSWSYLLTNNEMASSSNFLSDFNLAINAPFENVTAPDGWSFTTDNSSYVYWFNTDDQLPYPHDIAPGLNLNGFSFTSDAIETQLSSYGLSSWDHLQDALGPSTVGAILAPSVPAAVPEPSTITTFSIGGLSLLLFAVRRRSKRNGQSV